MAAPVAGVVHTALEKLLVQGHQLCIRRGTSASASFDVQLWLLDRDGFHDLMQSATSSESGLRGAVTSCVVQGALVTDLLGSPSSVSEEQLWKDLERFVLDMLSSQNEVVLRSSTRLARGQVMEAAIAARTRDVIGCPIWKFTWRAEGGSFCNKLCDTIVELMQSLAPKSVTAVQVRAAADSVRMKALEDHSRNREVERTKAIAFLDAEFAYRKSENIEHTRKTVKLNSSDNHATWVSILVKGKSMWFLSSELVGFEKRNTPYVVNDERVETCHVLWLQSQLASYHGDKRKAHEDAARAVGCDWDIIPILNSLCRELCTESLRHPWTTPGCNCPESLACTPGGPPGGHTPETTTTGFHRKDRHHFRLTRASFDMSQITKRLAEYARSLTLLAPEEVRNNDTYHNMVAGFENSPLPGARLTQTMTGAHRNPWTDVLDEVFRTKVKCDSFASLADVPSLSQEFREKIVNSVAQADGKAEKSPLDGHRAVIVMARENHIAGAPLACLVVVPLEESNLVPIPRFRENVRVRVGAVRLVILDPTLSSMSDLYMTTLDDTDEDFDKKMNRDEPTSAGDDSIKVQESRSKRRKLCTVWSGHDHLQRIFHELIQCLTRYVGSNIAVQQRKLGFDHLVLQSSVNDSKEKESNSQHKEPIADQVFTRAFLTGKNLTLKLQWTQDHQYLSGITERHVGNNLYAWDSVTVDNYIWSNSEGIRFSPKEY